MNLRLKLLLANIWRMLLKSFDNQYERYLRTEIGDSSRSLLDVGCGFNSPVQCLPSRPIRLVGIDIHQPAIEQSNSFSIHDEYYCMNVLDISDKFGSKEFDCVLASDLLEHLTEQNGYRLITAMEKIARKKVIIYTPNGFLPQEEEYDNPMQKHLSGWNPQKMKHQGYRVFGIEGFKPLRGRMAEIHWRPTRLWLAISLFSQILTTHFPKYAFRLF